jgi:hypothetical protein
MPNATITVGAALKTISVEEVDRLDDGTLE